MSKILFMFLKKKIQTHLSHLKAFLYSLLFSHAMFKEFPIMTILTIKTKRSFWELFIPYYDKRRSLPIVFSAPNPNSMTTSDTTSVTRDDVINVTTHNSNGLIKEITSKFLSSSVASTNIMDTSELPMPIINSERQTAENKTSSQGINFTNILWTAFFIRRCFSQLCSNNKLDLQFFVERIL